MVKPVKRAHGTRVALASKPIKAGDAEAIKKRAAVLESAEDIDMSWLIPGAMGITTLQLVTGPSIEYSDKSIKNLIGTYQKVSNPILERGAVVLYSGQLFITVQTPRGPAKTVRHCWIDGGGNKFIISLKTVKNALV